MITVASLEEKIKKNSYRILGQIEISDEEFEELKQYSTNRIHYLSSIIPIDLKLSVFLVQVAIREYKEGRYWPCFSEIVGETLPSNKQNYIGQIFLKTVKHYGLFMLEKRENGTQTFVENIKAHAFVTNWYLDGYFEFSQAYYENNLFRQIDEDIENDFWDLSNFMKTTLGGNSDTISEKGSATHAARSYRLLKSTRSVISQADPDLLKEVFYPTLKLIDSAFYDDKYPQGQDRFEVGFIKWHQKLAREEKSKGTAKTPADRKLYSQKPYIAVDRKNMGFTLVIPKQKFRSEECNGTATVLITCNGTRTNLRMELYKSFGIFISEEIRIAIEDVFCPISICISSEVDKNYLIPASKYRIFNASWELIKKFEVGHNHFLVQKDNEVLFQGDSRVIDVYEDEQWVHYDVMITKETVCFLNSLMLSVIGEFSQDPVFDQLVSNFSAYLPNGTSVKTARNHPAISFFVSQEKYKGTVLEVNEQKYPIRSINSVSVARWPQDENLLAVTMRLDEGDIIQEDGYYVLGLNIPEEPPRILSKYLLLKHVNCRVTNNIYVYADTGAITLYPDGHEFEIDSSWEMKIFADGSEKYYFPLEENMDHVDIVLDLDNKSFVLRSPLKVFAYGFSRTNLTISRTDYLWYKDLRESLYLRLPDATDVSVHLNRDESSKVMAEIIDDGLFRVDISSLVYAINDEKRLRRFYLNVDYTTYRKKWLTLPIIYRKPSIFPYFVLNYNEEEGIYTEVSIVGNADVYLTVKDHATHGTIIDRKQIVGGKNYLPELSPDGFYDFEPVMVQSDDFFDISEEPLQFIKGTGVVSLTDLTNCRLPIESLVYQESEIPLGSQSYFINIQEKINPTTYIGALKSRPAAFGSDNKAIKYCGKAMITVYNSDQGMTVSMVLFSIGEEDWLAPYYDKATGRILSGDSPIVQNSKDYDRFVLLDEDEAEYSIKAEGIRRYR